VVFLWRRIWRFTLSNFSFSADLSIIQKDLLKLQKESPKHFTTALEKGMIQLGTWTNSGTGESGGTPPIKDGFLRGSMTTAVGNKMTSKGDGNNEFARTSESQKPLVGIIRYSAPYAAAQHENLAPAGKKWQPGEASQRAGDTEGKWLENSIEANKEALFKLVATFYGKEAGFR